jgi:hypothetical protein
LRSESAFLRVLRTLVLASSTDSFANLIRESRNSRVGLIEEKKMSNAEREREREREREECTVHNIMKQIMT